jgi:hypothetical protein
MGEITVSYTVESQFNILVFKVYLINIQFHWSKVKNQVLNFFHFFPQYNV